MNTQIVRTPMGTFESLLVDLAKAIWEKDCIVVYKGESFSKLKNIKWLNFTENQDDFSLHVSENNTESSILTLMNYVTKIDESEIDLNTLAFTGVSSSVSKMYHYSVYSTESIEQNLNEPFASFFVGHGSYHDSSHAADLSYISEYSKFLNVPFSVSLTIPERILSHTEKFVCSRGSIRFKGLRKDLQMYTYFSKGGLEMSINENENITNNNDNLEKTQVPIEFVVNGFEMSFEEALSLRPGDKIEIDTPKQLQGVIRIAGGEWVTASLTLKDDQALLSVEKMIERETSPNSNR